MSANIHGKHHANQHHTMDTKHQKQEAEGPSHMLIHKHGGHEETHGEKKQRENSDVFGMNSERGMDRHKAGMAEVTSFFKGVDTKERSHKDKADKAGEWVNKHSKTHTEAREGSRPSENVTEPHGRLHEHTEKLTAKVADSRHKDLTSSRDVRYVAEDWNMVKRLEKDDTKYQQGAQKYDKDAKKSEKADDKDIADVGAPQFGVV